MSQSRTLDVRRSARSHQNVGLRAVPNPQCLHIFNTAWNPVRCERPGTSRATLQTGSIGARSLGPADHQGESGAGLFAVTADLIQPFGWTKRRHIVVDPTGDLFKQSVSDGAIDQIFAVMALAPRHTFQVLTSHIDRLHTYVSDETVVLRLVDACNRPADGSAAECPDQPSLTALARAVRREPHRISWPLPNVWIGVCVQRQPSDNERITLLRRTPAAVRFVGAGPASTSVDLRSWLPDDPRWASSDGRLPPLDLLLIGGSSAQVHASSAAWSQYLTVPTR